MKDEYRERRGDFTELTPEMYIGDFPLSELLKGPQRVFRCEHECELEREHQFVNLEDRSAWE